MLANCSCKEDILNLCLNILGVKKLLIINWNNGEFSSNILIKPEMAIKS